MRGHIVTPEGREVAATRASWRDMPADWRSLAAFFTCPGCPTPIGQPVDHPAAGDTIPPRPDMCQAAFCADGPRRYHAGRWLCGTHLPRPRAVT